MVMRLIMLFLLTGMSVRAQTSTDIPALLPDFIYLPQTQKEGNDLKNKVKELKTTIDNNPVQFLRRGNKPKETTQPVRPLILNDNGHDRRPSSQWPAGLGHLDTLPNSVGTLKKALSEIGLGIQMVIDSRQRWSTGQVLNVCFLDIPEPLGRRIFSIASEWNENGHITFRIKDPAGYNDCTGCFGCVRVSSSKSFLPSGVVGFSDWSAVGKEINSIGSTDVATMYFNNLPTNISDRELRTRVLHEFGHALGLAHEHQSPSAAACLVDSIRAVTALLNEAVEINGGKAISSADRDNIITAVRQNYILLPPTGQRVVSNLFDSTSVLNYALPASFFSETTPKTCFSRERADKLSPNDIGLFRLLYENRNATNSAGPIFRVYRFDKLLNILQVEKKRIVPLNATENQIQAILKEARKSIKNIDQYLQAQR